MTRGDKYGASDCYASMYVGAAFLFKFFARWRWPATKDVYIAFDLVSSFFPCERPGVKAEMLCERYATSCELAHHHSKMCDAVAFFGLPVRTACGY